jgi:hypothetical protein
MPRTLACRVLSRSVPSGSLAEDFTVGVELSQKLSVRRHIVDERHASAIEDLYGGSPS